MHLICPSCDTTFLIDPGQIGPEGRRVRCGNCGHDWVQARPEEAEAAAGAPEAEAPELPAFSEELPEEPAPAEEMPEPPLQEAGERAPRRGVRPARAPRAESGGRRVAAGWIVFLLVVIGLGAGAYFGRDRIVAAVPAAADLYRLAGLDVVPEPGAGLELREVKSVRRMIDGERVVVIEGLVANVTDQLRPVPELRASLTDASGDRVDEWTFSAEEGSLPPGGITTFETSTKNAPREGSLAIDFVNVQ